MKDMNRSFDQLRERVPFPQRKGKRISKIELLKLAIKYIQHLKYILSFPSEKKIPQHIIQFDPSMEAWEKMYK